MARNIFVFLLIAAASASSQSAFTFDTAGPGNADTNHRTSIQEFARFVKSRAANDSLKLYRVKNVTGLTLSLLYDCGYQLYVSDASGSVEHFRPIDGSTNIDYSIPASDKDSWIVFCSKGLGSLLLEKDKMLEGYFANFDVENQCGNHVNLLSINFASGRIRINSVYLVSSDALKVIERKFLSELDSKRIDVTYPMPRIIPYTN